MNMRVSFSGRTRPCQGRGGSSILPTRTMKNIFFVRHGESEGNAGPSFQGPDSPLTEKGIEQAVIIAERCANLPINCLISSTLNRAKQTAEIISEKISIKVEYSDLFIENRRPTAQIGLIKDSKESQEIYRIVIDNFSKDNVHHSDEENFNDLNKRAEAALSFLVNRKEDNILVVMHGLFLRVLFGRVVSGDNFSASVCLDLLRSIKTNNTGITSFEYEEETNKWSVRTWNDHAHLG